MDDTTIVLRKLMDGCSARHTVLANNLANANTPGFKRADVDFKDALADALKSGNTEMLVRAKPEVRTDRESQARPDGNNVSAQKELGLLSLNGLVYETAAKTLSKKYERLQMAIKGK